MVHKLKRILVIDDDDGVREVIQICLETIAGWKVISTASGREGLTAAENQKPDAILLDVMMPEMDVLFFSVLQELLVEFKHKPTLYMQFNLK